MGKVKCKNMTPPNSYYERRRVGYLQLIEDRERNLHFAINGYFLKVYGLNPDWSLTGDWADDPMIDFYYKELEKSLPVHNSLK